MNAMLKNRWTTIGGIIAAIATWWTGVGAKYPETQQEWVAAVVALAMALLGVFAKDATTGSTPKAE